jgi:hypothetical protein
VYYERALKANPDWTLALVNLGNVCKDLGDLEAASRNYRRALEIDPNDVSALHNLGGIAFTRGDSDVARCLYEGILARDAGEPRTLNSLGVLELHEGKIDLARLRFERALENSPGFVDARYGLGLCSLAQQDFAVGWDAYELRFRTDPPESAIKALPLPLLNMGEPFRGKRVAVRLEQGIGDQILYSTLLPDLLDLGVAAVCEVDSRLTERYRDCLPRLEVVSPRDPAIASCEAQIPIGSLPRLLRRTRESFDAQPAALLRPDQRRAREMLNALDGRKPVGIAWRSMPRVLQTHFGQRKSASLSCFAPFANMGVELLDLQYGDVELERAEFDRRYPGLRIDIPGLDRFKDLEGMLAAIEACSLVITTSNVTAHLAGAIGKRTWLVCLRSPLFYYWYADSHGKSLWYPSVEVCCETGWKDWDAAFESLAWRYQNEIEGRAPAE